MESAVLGVDAESLTGAPPLRERGLRRAQAVRSLPAAFVTAAKFCVATVGQKQSRPDHRTALFGNMNRRFVLRLHSFLRGILLRFSTSDPPEAWEPATWPAGGYTAGLPPTSTGTSVLW
jgi:hypothetical protein